MVKHLGDNFGEERQEDDNLEKRCLRRGIHLEYPHVNECINLQFHQATLLILVRTRQETGGGHCRGGVLIKNGVNSWRKGYESLGYMQVETALSSSQVILENVYVDHTFTIVVIETEVFIPRMFQNVNQGRVDLAQGNP